jgi:DNA processing protein
MSRDAQRLRGAIAAFEFFGTPGRLAAAVRGGANEALQRADRDLSGEARIRADSAAASLAGIGVGVVVNGDAEYPRGLTELPSPPPVLFYLGNLGILDGPAVGMCGSRTASEAGIRAARLCGAAVARQGLAIISGYARGVDTETHLAALAAGGKTVVVLAEGFAHFSVKQAFGDQFDLDRVLVLSQFPPRQTWHVGAAMTRNGVIAALGRALVVIEARERGGTLDAGLRALSINRPVLALEFESGATPAGNSELIRQGAIPIRRPADLVSIISEIKDPPGAHHLQMPLTLR